MKALVQKLPLDRETSFVARSYRTPNFETPWHQHLEIELVLITESIGTAFIGDALTEYRPDDVYLLGENLPHWFRKADPDAFGCAIVVHFPKSFWGKSFLDLPEVSAIRQLLETSAQGLRLQGKLSLQVAQQLRAIEQKRGFAPLATLLDCLHLISQSDEYTLMNQSPVLTYSSADQAQIHQVMEFTMAHFQQKIRLEEVADLTHRSVSAFCQFFKKSTKKSYGQFLTEIRLAHACKLLTSTSQPITQICFESGFHNWANFSKHFKAQLGLSPRQYRRQHA